MRKLNINRQNIDFESSDNLFDQENLNVMQSIFVLKRLAQSWGRRAQVRKDQYHDNIPFIKEADDFLVDLLPFKDHPNFLSASEEMKSIILSCGWIIYNQKTLSIESEVVNPICLNILLEKVPGVSDSISKQIISETMIDESYHVLLVTNAINITRQKREISLKISEFNLVKSMKKLQSECFSQWEKVLVHLATAVVSEIFISDYLKLLSENREIQPLNRFITKIHRNDELAHGTIFKNLLKCIYASLNIKEREFFASVLAKPIRWFADKELDIWQFVLHQIGFENASHMIKDCEVMNANSLSSIDYSELIYLANDIGITDMAIGLDSFHREGIII